MFRIKDVRIRDFRKTEIKNLEDLRIHKFK